MKPRIAYSIDCKIFLHHENENMFENLSTNYQALNQMTLGRFIDPSTYKFLKSFFASGFKAHVSLAVWNYPRPLGPVVLLSTADSTLIPPMYKSPSLRVHTPALHADTIRSVGLNNTLGMITTL